MQGLEMGKLIMEARAEALGRGGEHAAARGIGVPGIW